MFFDGNKMQAFATRGVGAPLAPGGEEIQPQPESGFENGENARVSPSARQIVAMHKHLLRLTRTRFRAVVDVAVHRRERRAVTVKRKFGGVYAHAGDRASAGPALESDIGPGTGRRAGAPDRRGNIAAVAKGKPPVEAIGGEWRPQIGECGKARIGGQQRRGIGDAETDRRARAPCTLDGGGAIGGRLGAVKSGSGGCASTDRHAVLEEQAV